MNRRSIIKGLCALGTCVIFPAIGKSKYTIKILQSRCVGCKDCYRVCPVDAIRFINNKAVVIAENCNGCLLCPAVCSYGAIVKCEKNDLPSQ